MTEFPMGDMPLPAPPMLFISLLLSIFTLHLISVWILIGGLILGIVRLAKTKDDWRKNKSVRFLPIVMALVMNLGVPPLLFLQVLYTPFYFTSSILIAIPWISVFFLLLSGYGMVYAARYGAQNRWQAIGFYVVSAISVLITAFFFSNNATLMIEPNLWQKMYTYTSQNGLSLHPELWRVIPRWIWVISPCFVAGVAMANGSRGWIVLSALLNILGLVFYHQSLPASVIEHPLVYGANIAEYILVGALILIVALVNPRKTLEEDGSHSFAPFYKRILWVWVALKGAVTIAFRHGVRSASLDPIYPLDALPVSTQVIPLIIFLFVLVIGIATVAWMYINGRKEVAI